MDLEPIFYAFFGGLLPAALWLWFWLKEDSARPEPKALIFFTFIAGFATVIMVLPFQEYIYRNFAGDIVLLFFLWALIEEVFKYAAAHIAALRNKAVDEPIDMIIYMVTASLGFAALENALFIYNPLLAGNIADGILTGNLRFVGASLLHVMTSSVVGLTLAFAFYKDKRTKRLAAFLGLILATVLHTMFNLSIMDENGGNTFVTFLVLWISVIGLLLFFEKIKRLKPVI